MRYVRKTPCAECPFRRKSWAGYLGRNRAAPFVESIAAQRPTECHMDVDYEDPQWKQKLDGVKACAGAAIFLANSFSIPRDEDYAAYVDSLGRDPKLVFEWPHEFIAHHDNDLNRKLAALPEEEDRMAADAELAQNALNCLDEDTIYAGETGDECPEDPDHTVEPVHVSGTALGRADDDDNYHYGIGKWVYTLDQ